MADKKLTHSASYLSSSNASANSDDESEGAGRSHTTGTGSNTSAEDTSKSLQEELSKQETRAVFRLRLAVILVLIGAAAAISTVVYIITSKAEHDGFGKPPLAIVSLNEMEIPSLTTLIPLFFFERNTIRSGRSESQGVV
jgi:hypothetical protein